MNSGHSFWVCTAFWVGVEQEIGSAQAGDRTKRSVAAGLREQRRRLAVLCFSFMQQLRERGFLPQRRQPGISGHRRITEEPASDDALEQIDRRSRLVQMREMTREIEEPFRIPEVGRGDAADD